MLRLAMGCISTWFIGSECLPWAVAQALSDIPNISRFRSYDRFSETRRMPVQTRSILAALLIWAPTSAALYSGREGMIAVSTVR